MSPIKIAIVVMLASIALTAGAADWPDFPFVFVVGKAKTEVPPDQVTVRFGVKAFDKNSDVALNTVKERGVEVARLLKEAGLKEEDIEAYQLDKRAIRARQEYTELEILGYEVTQDFRIEISDIEVYTPLIDQLISLEKTNLGATFDVSNRESIETRLVAEAGVDARARADALTTGLGASIESIFAISEQAFLLFPGKFGLHDNFDRMFEKAMTNGGHGVIFTPSTIPIEKSVNVVFKLRLKGDA